MNYPVSIQWYIENIWVYVVQMLPGMCIAVVLFALAYPLRKKRLAEKGLYSSTMREITLVWFVLFLAGLAALTVFPEKFWACCLDRFFFPELWGERWNWTEPWELYPSLEKVLAENRELHNLFVPFQEIKRAMLGIPWLTFMLLGNIFMFLPVGFFPVLLWRNGTWRRSLLAGLVTSGMIETVQFFIGRRTDIDDVILNTSGAMIGFGIYCLIRLLMPNQIKGFQCVKEG